MRQFIFLLLSLFGGNQFLSAQNVSIAEIMAMPNDTAKVEQLLDYAKSYSNINVDSALLYTQNAETLSKTLNYRRGIVGAQLVYGTLEFYKGNYPEAKEIISEAIHEAEAKNYTNLVAGGKLLLGNIYAKNKEFDLALKVYREGLHVCELSNNTKTASSIYVSIGICKRQTGDLDSALFYYEKVLKIQEETVRDSVVLSSIYNNIGSIYYFKGDIFTTEFYILKALEINRLTKNTRFEIINLANLGSVWGGRDGNLTKSMSYFNEAIRIAKERGAKEELYSFYETVGDVYYEHEKYKEAFDNLKVSNAYKDSVFGETKQKQMLDLEKKYETQKIQDSLRLNQQELEMTQVKESEAIAIASRTKWQLTGALLLLLSIVLLLLYVYNNSKKQKKLNTLLLEKNEEINFQKLVIEEKNTELTDSITYAKRIQTALLPSDSKLNDVLKDYFLLFKPKDIVSGDFYFAKEINGLKYFSVADCTGHGVPGAMVSMLGYELLSKISVLQLADASAVLTEVNAEMTSTLSNKSASGNQEEIRDGMDISFCMLDRKNKLSFSGANNGCLVIRSKQNLPPESKKLKIHSYNEKIVIEMIPNSRPIGYYYGNEKFENTEFQLLSGDMLYLFSDGFSDQFGGEKGKKLKTSRFREELVKISDLPTNDQYKHLHDFLKNWQGQFDQLDDITVLGVHIH